MEVTVDRDACIASGQCVWAVPSVFAQSDDEGIVVLLDAHPSQELHPKVREAAHVCPARAIGVQD